MEPLEGSGRKPPARSMIEQLPADVMTRILGFVKLPERLQLARSSSILLKLITKDCTELWTTVDLSSVSEEKRRLLTDPMLAGLLTRVNARDVTRDLNLEHNGAPQTCQSQALGMPKDSFFSTVPF